MSLTAINSSNIFQKEAIGKVRTVQEDSHDMAVLTPNGDVFVVCDGMGGHVGGKQASSIAVKSILEYLKKEKFHNPLQAMNEALQFANMQILGYAKEHPELKGMGTTACILLLQDSDAYIAHVGDSRIYLYLGKEKKLHRITKDHSYVQTLVDAGELSDEDAENHPKKNRILRALGIQTVLEPTFSEKPILPKNGDVFLICSDGLSGMLHDDKINSILTFNSTIQQKGDMLINLALEEGGLDNITLQLIQISNSPWKKSVFKSCNPKNKHQSKKSDLRKLKKILMIVLIALLCFIGAGTVYHFRHKNSQKEEIKELRKAKIEAENKYTDSNNIFQKKRDDYNATAKRTADAKAQFEKNPNDEISKNAYHIQQEIDNNKKKELDSLEKELNQANEEMNRLKNSFSTDSINIVSKK